MVYAGVPMFAGWAGRLHPTHRPLYHRAAIFARDITSTCFCRISQRQQIYSSTIEYQRVSLRILQTDKYNTPFMPHIMLNLSSLLVIRHQRSRLYGENVLRL